MKPNLRHVIAESLKVGAGICATLYIEPWVEAVLSSAPTAVHYIVSALIAGALVVLLFEVVLGIPRIDVRWREQRLNAQLTQLIIRHERRTNKSQKFDISLAPAEMGFGAFRVAHALLAATKPSLVISIGVAPERIAVLSYEPKSQPRLEPHADGINLSVDLSLPLPRLGRWIWGVVQWTLDGELSGETTFPISYKLEHPNPWIQRLLNLVIRIQPNVHKLHIERT